MAPDIERHSVGLLEWLHDNFGDGSTVHPITGYLTEAGLSGDDGYSIVEYLADRGLATNLSSYGDPCAQITPDGMAWVQRQRAAQADPTQRVHALRTRMLLWLDEPDNQKVEDWSGFVASPSAVYQGVPFTQEEFAREAEYLSRKGLISAFESWSVKKGMIKPRLTDSGRDCITDHGGNVSDYLTRGRGGGNTTNNNITMTGSTGNITVGSENVVQNVNETQQVAPGFEAIAEAVADTLRQLPAIGLPEEDQQDAEAVANEVLAEVVRDEPNRGWIRRAVATLRGYLAPVAAGAALGAEEGAQELARKAIEHLGSSF